MAKKLVDGKFVELDREQIINVSKPIFYGYLFIAGVRMLNNGSSSGVGTIMGLSVMASITFVSAGLAKGVDEDWRAFLDLISVISLLFAVLFGSYLAAAISLGV